MKKETSPIPVNEQERLESLLSYDILDSFSEQEYDNITSLASYICHVPIVTISLIDEKRQWFKSQLGLDATEAPREVMYCQYTIMDDVLLEIPNISESEKFKNTEPAIAHPDLKFYAGVPLQTPDGFNIGTLCIADFKPKKLDAEQKKALNTLAKNVITLLELRKKNLDLKLEVEKLLKKALDTVNHELDTYKSALDVTSSVVITDAKGIINFVNDTTCLITKYSREELIGQNSSIFKSGFHSKEFFDKLWRTISSGELWKNEIKNKAKDGTFYWVDTTIVPFLDEEGRPDRYVSIKRDITKQKLEANKITQFFNLSLDYLCVVNTDGYFEVLSPTFPKQLGFSYEELKAKPFAYFLHEDDINKTARGAGKVADGTNNGHFEARFKCKNGDYKLLSWKVSHDNETGFLYAIARDITVSKKVNEENRRLSLVAKGTNNIILITDKDRKIEWVNQPFEILTGYTLDEVIGKKPSLLQYEETDVKVVAQIREALNKQQSFKGEIKNRSKSGRVYWLEISISPVFDENNELVNFIAIEADITEKKRKDLSILNLIASQTAIFNGVGLAVVFTDANGVIKRINKAGLNLIEYTHEEVIGKTPEFFHDLNEVVERSKALTLELGQKIEPGFDTFVIKTRGENNVDASEWTYVSKSGKRIPVWLSITCIKNIEGTIIGYLGVAEDYRIKKQAELELINAKNAAEQAVYAKDSFLANMSHEIRTPLNAIIGFTELISQSKLDEVQLNYIGNIQIAGDNLLLIINDILDLSKIESGQLEIESYPFNLKVMLKHVYDLLKIKAAENDINFNLFLDVDMPEFIVGDKGRINQIMMNLAGNALKFTQSGDVTISVKTVSETKESVKLRFSVKDTGIGIPEEKLATIFERFVQAEASTTRKFGGSGLGLNIVKQLIELQNGEIYVKSQLGVGSEFYFILELKKASSSSIDVIKDNNLISKKLGKISILLCEDNPLNQLLAKSVIHKFGFDLEIANNGQEGIDLLLKNKYDLILMDLQMPVKDGYQTTMYIRNELKFDIPIIAMTAHSLVGEQQKCYDIGMNAYVAKPFKQIELLETIQSVVENFKAKDINAPIQKELLTNNIVKDTIVDFSYLETLTDGNSEFINEMILLFIENVSVEIELLEQKINEKDYIEIKSTAHHMKSSLSMFSLHEEVEFLEQTEQRAKNSMISSDIVNEFAVFKRKIVGVIEVLKKTKRV